jgi:putative SOS response-associated peptidase YedK
LIPYWIDEENPKLKPINATAERVASAPMFRAAYTKRRCLVPIDSFFEWAKLGGARGTKQPYVIAMKSGAPFALAGLWEGWRRPNGEILRTFCIVTTKANELLAGIHDRMPVILPADAYDQWLSPLDPDPRDLLMPYPSEPMVVWPISPRVNKTDNDDGAILERIA